MSREKTRTGLPGNMTENKNQDRHDPSDEYSAWSPELSSVESDRINEILAHAYPSQCNLSTDDQAALGVPSPSRLSEITGERSPGSGDTESVAEILLTDTSADDLNAELAEANQVNLEELKELCTPLEIDSRCNVCAIVCMCLNRDVDRKWLLNYSLLCYKCGAAPRTPLSSLIVASEFLYLLETHFRDIDFGNVLRDHILTIFDFQVHFFINRCFASQEDCPVSNDNITLNHIAVVKSLLMREDTVPYNKQKRPSLQRRAKKPRPPIATEPAVLQYGKPSERNFTGLFFYMWAGTNVFHGLVLTDMAIKKHYRLSAVARKAGNLERFAGPVYLAQTPVFTLKNGTTPVCLLCELMACGRSYNVLLAKLRDDIVNYCHNNLKLVDRIQLTLAELLRRHRAPTDLQRRNRDVSNQVTAAIAAETGKNDTELDTATFLILRQVGVTGLYKHFFCDPQCAANIKCTRPDILFREFEPGICREVKLAICYDNNYISPVDKTVWLYAQIFKAFQVSKREFKTKTQLADFIREFKQLLDTHEFKLIDPAFVVDKYV